MIIKTTIDNDVETVRRASANMFWVSVIVQPDFCGPIVDFGNNEQLNLDFSGLA